MSDMGNLNNSKSLRFRRGEDEGGWHMSHNKINYHMGQH